MGTQSLLLNILAPRLAVDIFDLSQAAHEKIIPSDLHTFAYTIECSIKSYFFKRREDIPTETIIKRKWFREVKTEKKKYTVDWLFNNCTGVELKKLARNVYELEGNREAVEILEGKKKTFPG